MGVSDAVALKSLCCPNSPLDSAPGSDFAARTCYGHKPRHGCSRPEEYRADGKQIGTADRTNDSPRSAELRYSGAAGELYDFGKSVCA